MNGSLGIGPVGALMPGEDPMQPTPLISPEMLQMLGPSVASRMQRANAAQQGRWNAGQRSPTPLTEENVWLADDVAGGLLGPLGMMGAIKAYHGSPHRFDKFSLDKIGTGEGAQAYGHGLYFAEAKDTARSYQKSLANIAQPDKGPEWVAKQWLSENGDVATAEAALRESIASWKANPMASTDPQLREMVANMESAIPLLGRVTPETGALYTTKLNVEPDDLLDWDKPLSEQSEKVRAALERANPVKIREGQAYIGDTLLGPADPGEEINFWNGILRSGAGNAYKQIERAAGKQEAARIFREAGIPGIRYLDQGSRGAGEGTRNFVIFDDKLVDIESVDPEFRSIFLQGGTK